MEKLNRKNVSKLWKMRHLTVKDFLTALRNHPELKFLATAVGIWWVGGLIMGVTIAVNVIYYFIRISHLVTG